MHARNTSTLHNCTTAPQQTCPLAASLGRHQRLLIPPRLHRDPTGRHPTCLTQRRSPPQARQRSRRRRTAVPAAAAARRTCWRWVGLCTLLQLRHKHHTRVYAFQKSAAADGSGTYRRFLYLLPLSCVRPAGDLRQADKQEGAAGSQPAPLVDRWVPTMKQLRGTLQGELPRGMRRQAAAVQRTAHVISLACALGAAFLTLRCFLNPCRVCRPQE